ncbi:tripartite tricarboxylate transporter substrate binding protein [Comamonas antarctica]|uniref:Bug family tripartite tricarboxylate transporter substrate binding protein n=1 Tax=Comamonas antarctica TaxID=2743470 RepID=UPI0028EDCDFC|nr:tripartite tricarboxylate transporter substrate binding protein [Comamonas antarctica]
MRYSLAWRKWGLCIGTAICAAGAWAQAFPSKPVTIVVPYAPGGPTDITARRVGELMAKNLGTAVLIENRPGAATTLAAAYIARAPKDGYTLFMAPGTTTSVNPYIYRRLSYKPEEFAPISIVSRLPFGVVAAPDFPAKNMQEFIAWAKAKPGGVSYGTTGTGSLTNIIGEWMGRTLGVKMVEVPYKGTAAAYADLMGGRIDVNIEVMSSAIGMHQAGKVRILGIMSEERAAQIPDVATLREAGYPNLVAYTNFGLLAPAGTPAPVINRLHQAVVAAVATPDFAAKLAAGGETAVSSASPKQFGELLHAEYVHWGAIVKPMNLALD